MKNYGLIPEIRKPEDWVFGGDTGIILEILQTNGHGWDEFLPQKETQSSVWLDVMGCVTFSALNVLETLAKRKFDEAWDKSDRFTAKLSGTTKNGNTVSNVAESIRKNDGIVDEENWAWDKNPSEPVILWADYYTTIPLNIKDLGATWLKNYQVNYEWVNPDKNTLKEALKYSPLQVTGVAWYKNSDGLYYSPLKTANHAFMLYDYVDDDRWLIFDSYDNTKKELVWDFKFASAFKYYLNKKSMALETLKQKNESDIVIKPLKGTIAPIIDDWGTYKNLLDKGLITEFKEVDSLGLIKGKRLTYKEY